MYRSIVVDLGGGSGGMCRTIVMDLGRGGGGMCPIVMDLGRRRRGGMSRGIELDGYKMNMTTVIHLGIDNYDFFVLQALRKVQEEIRRATKVCMSTSEALIFKNILTSHWVSQEI